MASERKRQYHLTDARLRSRLDQLTDHEEIKSLREEIGLTRILIEGLMNSAQNDTERAMRSATYIGLVQTLDRLVKTTHQIEQNLGLLLQKPAVVVLSQQIIHILNDELRGVESFEERIDRIAHRMGDAIEHITNEQEENK